jgi:hypothetical protein
MTVHEFLTPAQTEALAAFTEEHGDYWLAALWRAYTAQRQEELQPPAPSPATTPAIACPLCGSTDVREIVAHEKPALECLQCNHWGTLDWGFVQRGAGPRFTDGHRCALNMVIGLAREAEPNDQNIANAIVLAREVLASLPHPPAPSAQENAKGPLQDKLVVAVTVHFVDGTTQRIDR